MQDIGLGRQARFAGPYGRHFDSCSSNVKCTPLQIQRTKDLRSEWALWLTTGACKRDSILSAPQGQHFPVSMGNGGGHVDEVHHTLWSIQHSPCSVLRAPCSMLHAACSGCQKVNIFASVITFSSTTKPTSSSSARFRINQVFKF